MGKNKKSNSSTIQFKIIRQYIEDDFFEIRCISGLRLVDRITFMEKISSKGTVERLVNRRLLTPYHENGIPKRPVNGTYNRRKTFYDLNEYLNIDFNEL